MNIDIIILIASAVVLGVYFTLQGISTFDDPDSTPIDKSLFVIVVIVIALLLMHTGMCQST